MSHADYNVLLVARTPQASTAPTFLNVGVIPFAGLSVELNINDIPMIQFSCEPTTLTPSVKQQLFDPFATPSEIVVYRDNEIIGRGPVLSAQPQGGTLAVIAQGLEYYTTYMYVLQTIDYINIDPYFIFTDLIDRWQDLTYGNFGIDFSDVTSSGELANRKLEESEVPNVFDVLDEVAADWNIDWWIDPSNRRLQLARPRGTNLSSSVMIDQRNVGENEGEFYSVQRSDVATYTIATGTHPDKDQFIKSTAEDTSGLQSFGRVGYHENFDNVKNTSTTQRHANRMRDQMSRLKFEASPDLLPGVGLEWEEFDIGDTIGYRFNSGLGWRSLDRRITSKQVSVTEEGDEELTVGFD